MNYLADSSFVISLFVDDARSKKAKATYYKMKVRKEKIYIPLVTVIEVVYVLEKYYRLPRQEVARYIYSILDTPMFEVEKYAMLYQVMEDYQRHTSINLGDLLVAAEADQKRIKRILSFDSHFKYL